MKLRLALLCAVVLPLAACAQDSAAPVASPAAAAQGPVPAGDPRIALAAKIPGAKPEDLRATPVPGIFELTHGTDISYISADAAYVFAGDLYKVANTGDFPNLSEDRRREMRLAMLRTVPETQMMAFGKPDAPHTITVFTDIDCPWCKRMHGQVDAYNKLGIRVRYLFFPRTGPDTESWFKADTVWCSADRNAAFTRATSGEKLGNKPCPSSPVAHDYQLGHDMGVNGTPGVVLETGELIPGYLAPPQMLAHIRKSIAENAARK